MKIVTTVFWMVCCCSMAWAQKNTLAAGGDASGPGGTVSYSIGQIDYVTATGTGGVITQGLQQPYEIFIVGREEKEMGLPISVYPNPTEDWIILDVGDRVAQEMQYVLYDMHGKSLTAQHLFTSQTQISMKDLAKTTYFLRVLEGDIEIRSFKIIKN
jgi:hypothetical protein